MRIAYDEGAVGVLGVDRHDELVVDLDHVLAVVEPPLLLGVEVGAVAGLEGDVVDPVRQPAPDRHPTPPFVGLDHHPLDPLEVPDGEQRAVADVVEDVLGPAAFGGLALDDLDELEAHGLCVELVRLLHVLDGDGEVMDAHGVPPVRSVVLP